MFAVKNIAGVMERRRKLSAFANNLTALLGLLVFGFPVTPATIRTAIAGLILVAAATLQFVVRRARSRVWMAAVRAIRGQVNDLNLRGLAQARAKAGSRR
jgi:hypothetical protein